MPDETALEEVNDFNDLKQSIKEVLGFDASKYTDTFLKRRIAVRMNVLKLGAYRVYKQKIKEDKGEQESLLKNLTIHVTEFFRDHSFWKFCREEFFPEVLKKLKEKDKINFWSAGCSTGQEPISILISLLEIDPTLADRIRIFGTDIDEQTLSIAKSAEYDNYGYRGLSPDHVKKYFYLKEENVCLKDEYKNLITISRHDIINDLPLNDIDVLFLRNTVIYFSKETKESLYLKIYDFLNRQSYFILGKTETLIGASREKFKPYNLIERIFEKNEA